MLADPPFWTAVKGASCAGAAYIKVVRVAFVLVRGTG